MRKPREVWECLAANKVHCHVMPLSKDTCLTLLTGRQCDCITWYDDNFTSPPLPTNYKFKSTPVLLRTRLDLLGVTCSLGVFHLGLK